MKNVRQKKEVLDRGHELPCAGCGARDWALMKFDDTGMMAMRCRGCNVLFCPSCGQVLGTAEGWIQ